MILESTLTCPHCGNVKPRPGDCCVFCSCGMAPCPPIQDQRGCCAKG